MDGSSYHDHNELHHDTSVCTSVKEKTSWSELYDRSQIVIILFWIFLFITIAFICRSFISGTRALISQRINTHSSRNGHDTKVGFFPTLSSPLSFFLRDDNDNLPPKDDDKHNKNNDKQQTFFVPFVVIPRVSRDGGLDRTVSLSRTISYSYEQYQHAIFQALQGMSQMLEQALALEQTREETYLAATMSGPVTLAPRKTTFEDVKLSIRIQQRIERLAECYESDERVLRRLLRPFPVVTALPSRETIYLARQSNETNSAKIPLPSSPNTTNSKLFRFNAGTSSRPSFQPVNNSNNENAYDSGTQVVAHLVRDWTESGKVIRQNIYDWCRIQLDRFCRRSKIKDRILSRVLVPGAGLGRLAYDLFYKGGYTVEANEISPVMAAVAYSILQANANGTIHPYAMDSMANEVNSASRYDSINFPDVDMHHCKMNYDSACNNSLSFTVGDFVGDYYSSQNESFDAIVTCFFIDTATNLYDYMDLIWQLLVPDGIWINVGPVQWHGNALLRPSVDELYDLIIYGYGMEVLHWKVDKIPVPYRQGEDNDDNRDSANGNYNSRKRNDDGRSFVRSTDYSAYRPLRFVVKKKTK